MVIVSHILQRACDGGNGDDCEKPVSQTIINVVPASILGGVLLISAIVLFVIIRKKRRQFKADEDKERESIEIDVYQPPSTAGHSFPEDSYHDPFDRTPSIYPYRSGYRNSEFSLAPPSPGRRGPSPSRSFAESDVDKGTYHLSTPAPTANPTVSKSSENLGHTTKSDPPQI